LAHCFDVLANCLDVLADRFNVLADRFDVLAHHFDVLVNRRNSILCPDHVLVNRLDLDLRPDGSLHLHTGSAKVSLGTHEWTDQETLVSLVDLAHDGFELARNSLGIEETFDEALLFL
jgi:hypothetical protein